MSAMIRILSQEIGKAVRINSQISLQKTFSSESFSLFNKVVGSYFISSSSTYDIGSRLPPLKLCKQLEIPKRNYAKGKDKGEKKKAHSQITDDELAQLIDAEKFKGALETALENLKSDYIKHLSIRTQAGGIESIPVELDGDKYSLGEMTQIIRKSATSIVIDSSAFPQATTNIKKAILESGMNLNPQQEGTTFYLQIPKVTKEHREGLAQNAKTLCEKTKLSMRNIQNTYLKKIKNKEGTVSEDLIFNGQLKVQEITREWIAKAESMMTNKKNELLKSAK